MKAGRFNIYDLKGKLTAHFEFKDDSDRLDIYDNDGSQIQYGSVINEERLSISNLSGVQQGYGVIKDPNHIDIYDLDGNKKAYASKQ